MLGQDGLGTVNEDRINNRWGLKVSEEICGSFWVSEYL